MNRHLSEAEIASLLSGSESPEAVDRLRHLANCSECAERAWHRFPVDQGAQRLLSSFKAGQNASPAWWIAAVAAGIAMAILLLVARPPRNVEPTIVKTETMRGEFRPIVEEAMKTGRLEMPPELRRVRVSPETQRSGRTVSRVSMQPRGVVVESTNPEYRWTGDAGALYVVSVFHGNHEVDRSEMLRDNRWQSARPLQRGYIYGWQVEIRNSTPRTIPAPPDPPAIFYVVSPAEEARLDRARRRFPSDHLLLGILYARAGLTEDAQRELRVASTSPDHREIAGRLLKSLQAWKTEDQ